MPRRSTTSDNAANSDRTLSLSEVVYRAKQWLAAVLEQENIKNIGLEEVSHQGGHWSVTLGFSRPWDTAQNAVSVLSGEAFLKRTFKVLTIDDKTGTVLSMHNREEA